MCVGGLACVTSDTVDLSDGNGSTFSITCYTWVRACVRGCLHLLVVSHTARAIRAERRTCVAADGPENGGVPMVRRSFNAMPWHASRGVANGYSA